MHNVMCMNLLCTSALHFYFTVLTYSQSIKQPVNYLHQTNDSFPYVTIIYYLCFIVLQSGDSDSDA